MSASAALTNEINGNQSTTGIIFDIVHGSFVDGYGVRTTVFLKGCPLRCLWCCNPESHLKEPEIKYTPSKCTECGNCLNICPMEAISTDAITKIKIDRNKCIYCGKCTERCYSRAIDTFGRSVTVNEVFRAAIKDEQYFAFSGGGVTIGGGEPTFQPQFTYALMKMLKAHYIHVAIDTCGYTTTELGFKILSEADLLLFDLKGLDVTDHIKNTGVSNEVILSNLKNLGNVRKSLIIRIPLITGYNDSEYNIIETAKLLSTMDTIQRVDIIPYHKYGIVKYEQLGREYPISEVETQSQKYIHNVKACFESYGLTTQIGG